MKAIKLIFSLVTILMISNSLNAQIAPVDDHKLAIGGYDVVSYFLGEPKRGFESFSTQHHGITYYFYTKANRAAFKKAPSKYLPQFGGFCAWGVGAKSAKFPIDPESYDIKDGKLYLFFNAPFNGERFSTILEWNAHTTELQKAAQENWKTVKNL